MFFLIFRNLFSKNSKNTKEQEFGAIKENKRERQTLVETNFPSLKLLR